MTTPHDRPLNGMLRRVGEILQLVTLVGLAIGFGVNYARIGELERAVSKIESGFGPPSVLATQTAVEIAVLKSQLIEIQKKIDQLQTVVIDTRNAVLRRQP